MLPKNILSLVICTFATYSACYSQTINSNNSLFIEYLTTVELTNKIKEGFSTVLVYSGGTEETGPHVVLGKHNFRVQSYAQRVAEGLGYALVAPILPFAPNSMAIQKFPGTITLDSLTFSNVNEQVALSLIASGFKHIILMSDHLNSQPPLAELAKKLSKIYHEQNIDVYYASDGYISQTDIRNYLLNYYKGLCGTTAKDRKLSIDTTQINAVVIKKTDTVAKETAYNATVNLFGVFADGAPVKLNMDINVIINAAANKTYLFFIASPRDKKEPIWNELYAIRKKSITSIPFSSE